MMLNMLRSNTYKASLPTIPNDFYDYKERQDEAAASLLSKNIWKLIKRNRHRLSQVPGCEGGAVSVLVSPESLSRLARDIVRVTEGEMYGVRGCVLNIEYRDGPERVHIGRIKCDPKLPVTSSLNLRLTRDQGKCQQPSSLLRLLGWSTDDVIYISPGYLLEKNKTGNI